MEISINPGTYVVAVSGGVDSIVLLDMLAKRHDVQLTVAHFEHGIREDSDTDRQLVEAAAKRYGLPFVFERGHLGPGVSEAKAREARYAFLHSVQEKMQADAIITAHHQDDVLETAILNMLRGTGRKGLSSLSSTAAVLRPLLGIPKAEILEYAAGHNLTWHEDSTNQDDRYLRNYIRHTILPRMGDADKATLLKVIERAGEINSEIDQLLHDDLQAHAAGDSMDRRWFIQLPHNIATEMLAEWLRQTGIRQFDRKLIERLVVFAKTAKSGKVCDINAEYQLKVSRGSLELLRR